MNGRSAFYYLSSLLVGLIFFLLAIFTTDSYILVRGLGYLDTYQLERHINIIEGKAGNPWQYRVLSIYRRRADQAPSSARRAFPARTSFYRS